MRWRDEGIVIGARRHGETSAILDAFTRDHGRHSGLVRGGRGRSQQPLLQMGNSLRLEWNARLEEHLGAFRVEPVRLRTALALSEPTALHGIGYVSALLRLLPERDPHPSLYEAAEILLERLSEARDAGAAMCRFELKLLEELGFGLDLGTCAATGIREDLAYVSPKSGRAVCRQAAGPYLGRLLALPDFLRDLSEPLPRCVRLVEEAAALTGYFLARDALGPRGLDYGASRASFYASCRAALQRGAPAA